MKPLTFILLLICSRCHAPGVSEKIQKEATENASVELFYMDVYRLPFSIDLLREALRIENIMYADVVLKQAILETGNFTSDIFLTANNIFGMRLAKVRKTTAICEYNFHASYNHWIDSVKDYKLWQDYYKNTGHDFTDYLAFLLTVGYATDTTYINKLKI